MTTFPSAGDLSDPQGAFATSMPPLAPSFGDSWDYTCNDQSTATQDETLSANPSFDTHLEGSSSTVASQDAAGGGAPVRVAVTGRAYLLEPRALARLRRLPWEWSAADGCLVLAASPELFEVLLDHVLFHTFPATLARHEVEELETLALVLGLDKLAAHAALMGRHRCKPWAGRPRRTPAPTMGPRLSREVLAKAPAMHPKRSEATTAARSARAFFMNKLQKTSHRQTVQNADCLS